MRMGCILITGILSLTGCGGTDAPVDAAEASVAQPVMVEVPGASLEATVWGEGELVLALPGLGADVAWFKLVAPAIAEAGFRVVALNPRGVGQSRGALEGLTLDILAEDVANTVAALGAERAHLLGWAFGNRVARAASQNHPDRVETVTLLAAGGMVPPSDAVMAAFNQLGAPGLADSTRLRLRRESLYAPMSDIVTIESAIGPRSWPEAAMAQRATNSGAQVDAWWSGGDAPMLIVQGRQDIMAPAENGLSLREQFPDRVTLVWVEDAGHMLLAEQPSAVAGEVVTFLRKHRGG